MCKSRSPTKLPIGSAVKGYDEAFGARPLSRLIQEKVKKPMAEELLFGKLKHGGIVKIDIDPSDDDKLSSITSPSNPRRRRLPAKPERA